MRHIVIRELLFNPHPPCLGVIINHYKVPRLLFKII